MYLLRENLKLFVFLDLNDFFLLTGTNYALIDDGSNDLLYSSPFSCHLNEN